MASHPFLSSYILSISMNPLLPSTPTPCISIRVENPYIRPYSISPAYRAGADSRRSAQDV